MLNEATIHDALKLEKLDLPDFPVIEAIDVQEIVDSTGVDSLEVWVILSDATKDEEITGEAVVQIKTAISQSLIESGVTLFAYINFAKRSEYHR